MRSGVNQEQQQREGGEQPKRKRGRPRDPGANRRILDAARAVAGELGVHGASMSAIADRSGVGKPTIYLRWANRREVIVAAIADIEAPCTPALRPPRGRRRGSGGSRRGRGDAPACASAALRRPAADARGSLGSPSFVPATIRIAMMPLFSKRSL